VTPADMLYGVNQTAQFDSHELQYISDYDGRLNVIAGLYYYHSDEDQVVSFREFNDDLIEVYAFFAGVLNAPVSDDNYLYRGEAKVDTRSYAAYGQLSWDWRDDTVLTFGLRYSYDDKEGTDNTFVQYVGDPDNPTVFREEADDWDEITWRLGVDHTLSDDHFLYAFVATGYRSGGFNFQKPSASPEVDQVEPEKLTSWEIGYKGSLWNNRANVGVSAYYYDYEDLQVLKRDVVNGIGLNTFVNAEEAVAMGIEFDWQLLLNQHWLFSGTWSFNDTEYEDFFSKDANACTIGPLAQGRGQDPLCQQDLNLKGNEFPLTPDHSVSLNATYMWDMFDLNWRATTSFLYRGDSWADAFNNPELDKIDDWSQWDARVTAATPDGDWEVQAFVRNISDSRAEIGIGRPSTVTQNATTTLSDPRLYGVRLTYNF
jgi:iron complex outermembrane receptor protein